MIQLNPNLVGTQQVGRMGELVVELELLARGWQVGNFNASTGNATGWDIFAARAGRSVKIRVKAKRPGVACFRWSAKANGEVLLGLDMEDDTDFVAAVSFHEEGGYDVYVLPARAVEAELKTNHNTYLEQPKRDGGVRKDSTQRNLFLDDKVDGPIGHGYAVTWRGFQNAWESLQ